MDQLHGLEWAVLPMFLLISTISHLAALGFVGWTRTSYIAQIVSLELWYRFWVIGWWLVRFSRMCFHKFRLPAMFRRHYCWVGQCNSLVPDGTMKWPLDALYVQIYVTRVGWIVCCPLYLCCCSAVVQLSTKGSGLGHEHTGPNGRGPRTRLLLFFVSCVCCLEKDYDSN